jgi:hypothetical protein
MKAPLQLFSAWMGPGPMTAAREKALSSIVLHCAVPFHFITNHNLNSWIHSDFPLHPAFQYLSAVHQCDYLRCYLMHVYGGGYTDIKPSTHNWNRFFDIYALSSKIGAGYTEIAPHGVARVGGDLEKEMKINYQKLIGVCSLIMSPRSNFTRKWFQSVNDLLDQNIGRLVEHPARHPQDHFGVSYEGGGISKYPLPWTGIGGDLFHPLAYRFSDHLLHLDMAPSFENYR